MFERAEVSIGGTVVRPVGRPKGSGVKESTTIRLDRDVLARFRREGRGWQSRINAALREWLKAQP